jgi:hypothetical protein
MTRHVPAQELSGHGGEALVVLVTGAWDDRQLGLPEHAEQLNCLLDADEGVAVTDQEKGGCPDTGHVIRG